MATTVILPPRRRPRPRAQAPAPATSGEVAAPITVVQDERVSSTTDSRGNGRTRAYVTNGAPLVQPGPFQQPRPTWASAQRPLLPARQTARPSRETSFRERAAPAKQLTFGRIILRLYPGGEFELERAGDNKVLKIEMIGNRPQRMAGPTPPEDAGPIRLSIRQDLNDLLVALDVAAGEQTAALSPESRREIAGDRARSGRGR